MRLIRGAPSLLLIGSGSTSPPRFVGGYKSLKFYLSSLSLSLLLLLFKQKAMTNDQIREVEVILDSIIKANNPVFAKEAPLPLAKEVQGLRACFDEVRPYTLILSIIKVLSTLMNKSNFGIINNFSLWMKSIKC